MNVSQTVNLSEKISNIPDVSCVYKLTNIVNGMIYIGSTSNLKRRIQEHKKTSKNPKYPIHHAIRKYGLEKFKLEILFEGDKNQIRKEEQSLLENLEWGEEKKTFYNLNKSAYNLDHSDPEFKKRHKSAVIKHNGKEVYQYSLDGKFLKKFNSMSEAEELGFSHSKISMCCTGKRRSAYGFLWSFELTENIQPYEIGNKRKPVIKIDKKTNQEIRMYESLYEAAKDVTSYRDHRDIVKSSSKISQCCRGKRISAYGFFWKFYLPISSMNMTLNSDDDDKFRLPPLDTTTMT